MAEQSSDARTTDSKNATYREQELRNRVVVRTVAAIVLMLQMTLIVRWLGTPDRPERIVGRLQIDINQASVQEFAVLPQVGPVLARRIVENRNRIGPFNSFDDLARVHGIGPSTLEQIRPYCLLQP